MNDLRRVSNDESRNFYSQLLSYFCSFKTGLGQEDCKFLTAQSTDMITGAKFLLARGNHFREHLIPGRVTVAVLRYTSASRGVFDYPTCNENLTARPRKSSWSATAMRRLEGNPLNPQLTENGNAIHIGTSRVCRNTDRSFLRPG